MHFDHVNTTNPMERVYSSWDWQHEFKTFPELNQERQIDDNWFILPMAMSQVLVCPPLLNEPKRINGMPWVEPYRKTCKRIGRKHTERRTILESWSLRDCPLHCLQAFYPWPGLTESRKLIDRPKTSPLDRLARLIDWKEPLAYRSHLTRLRIVYIKKEGFACYYFRIIKTNPRQFPDSCGGTRHQISWAKKVYGK